MASKTVSLTADTWTELSDGTTPVSVQMQTPGSLRLQTKAAPAPANDAGILLVYQLADQQERTAPIFGWAVAPGVELWGKSIGVDADVAVEET